MYSNVTLLGRFTRQPELKITPNSMSVTSFDLAVERRNGNGEKQTDFIPCVVFGKGAENVCKYMDKGRHILVTGRLQTCSWEGNDGVKRKVTEVYVSDFKFIPDGKKHEASPEADPGNSNQY